MASLAERLRNPDDAFKITPAPAADDIGPSTIDLRVGSIFLSARRSVAPAMNVEQLRRGGTMFDEFRVFRQYQGGHAEGASLDPLEGEGATDSATFVMQPRQFVLAATLEYLCMPPDLGALIQSRSTYGRMGIIAATAGYIGPGYKGSPTLELVNAGEVPILLEPFTAICQLVILPSESLPALPRPSRYQLATRPSAFQPTIQERLTRETL